MKMPNDDQVRAFAGWPGTTASFEVYPTVPDTTQAVQPLDLKILATKVPTDQAVCMACVWPSLHIRSSCFPNTQAGTWAQALAAHPSHSLVLLDDVLVIQCADGSLLGILQVQAPGKRAVDARAFANGLVSKGTGLRWLDKANTPVIV